MSRDPYLRLEEIIEACDRLQHYIGSLDFSDFDGDVKTQDAVIRVFEIIGEAVRKLKEIDPEISISSAKQIIGLRNMIVHAYDAIDPTTLWKILIIDLPVLKREIETLKN